MLRNAEFLARRIEVVSSGCWEWSKSRTPQGYGTLAIDGRTAYAHRFAWELFYGTIPAGLVVCHRCDNPPCVHPAHLFIGTRSDNTRDSVAKGRWTRNRQTPPPNARHEEIRRLRSAGMPRKEIMARVGCSLSVVHSALYRKSKASARVRHERDSAVVGG